MRKLGTHSPLLSNDAGQRPLGSNSLNIGGDTELSEVLKAMDDPLTRKKMDIYTSFPGVLCCLQDNIFPTRLGLESPRHLLTISIIDNLHYEALLLKAGFRRPGGRGWAIVFLANPTGHCLGSLRNTTQKQ